jgi:hypothetical protein
MVEAINIILTIPFNGTKASNTHIYCKEQDFTPSTLKASESSLSVIIVFEDH